MKLNLFDGGLNTRLDPRLTPHAESLINVNVDTSKGILKSEKLPLETDLDLKPYAYYYAAEKTWVSFDEPTQFLEFQGTLYYIRDGKAYKYKQDGEQHLGIEGPEDAPPVTALYPGIRWAAVAGNETIGAGTTLVAVGNKGDTEWSHAVTMVSKDLGDTWTIQEHPDVDTQWLSVAYCTLTSTFLASGRHNGDTTKALWRSTDGIDWYVVDFSAQDTILFPFSDLQEIWNIQPALNASGALSARQAFALAKRETGDTYIVELYCLHSTAPNRYWIEAYTHLPLGATMFDMYEQNATTRTIVAVNGTSTIQHGGPSATGTTGWTSYEVPTEVGAGWHQVKRTYSLEDIADRWLIISEKHIKHANTLVNAASWVTKYTFNNLNFPYVYPTAISDAVIVWSGGYTSEISRYVGTNNGIIYRLEDNDLGPTTWVKEESPLQSAILAIGALTVGDPAALSEKPFSGLAIDREGYIAARQLTGDWRISRLTTSKVLAAAFHPTGGLLFATEAGELLVTATGYDFEEITQPSGEGKVLALAYSEVATVFFVLFEGNRLGIYQDGEFTIEDLSSYSQLADSPKMYYTAGTLALWDPSVAHTTEVKIVSVNIYTTVPTIGAHTFATIAGTKYIHTFTHDFELRGYILADSASDTANCDLYLAKGTASAALISSFYLTEGRPAIIARSNIRYLDETLVGPHGTAETVVFTTPGSLLKAELPSLVSDPLTITDIPAMWGAKASAIVRTLNHTSIYFEDNGLIFHQTAFSPYYGGTWLRSKPYEKAVRGFIAAAGVAKTETPLVAVSNLPCPKFIVKGSSPDLVESWEYRHAGDSVYAYQWAYTYYNEKDRTESRPSPVSAEIAQTELGNASATVILKGSEDSQVSLIRLYRIGGPFTEFTLVEELPNEDQVYIDYLLEPSSVVLMRTDDNYPPPLEGLLGLTYYNSRFYSLQGLRLYFTDDSVNPNYWPPENYITLPDEGTGLVATAFGLYIFTERTISVLTGQGPIDAILTTVDNTVGTGYTDTILSKGNTVFFLAKDGVYQINGLEVSRISQTQLDEGTEFNAVNAVFYRSQLLAQLEDRVLVLDLRYLPTWKHLDFGTSRLIVGNGQLLAIKGGDTIELFKHEDDAELHYLSPRYVETGVTVLKSYNVMYIASQGEFELSVFVDGEKVVEELELASKYVQEVQIPLGARRGYDIQLELKGKGEVYEIEWLPKMREKQ